MTKLDFHHFQVRHRPRLNNVFEQSYGVTSQMLSRDTQMLAIVWMATPLLDSTRPDVNAKYSFKQLTFTWVVEFNASEARLDLLSYEALLLANNSKVVTADCLTR